MPWTVASPPTLKAGHGYIGSGYLMLILILSSYYFNNPCYSETDTLKQGIELKEWDYLISSNRVFILKFFGFGSTISSYLGVFYYNKFPNLFAYHVPRDAVWVANRNDPIQDTYSNFRIDVHGKLSIFSSGGTVLDLFTPTLLVKRNTSVTLLDSGNLVLHELFLDGSVKQVLWQSFDYPTDTLLPGMKLGINFRSGHRWSLSSWASDRLPALGSFSLTVDPNSTGQLMILRHGNIHWTSGIWQNGQFEKSDPRWYSSPGLDVRLYHIFNETEQSFMYLTKTYDSFPALTIHQDGRLTGEPLNLYVQCGLTTRYSSPGCSYEFEHLKCREGSYLIDVFGYIYGDEYEFDETYNWTLDDCKRICWANCSCIAYSYATKNRKGCKTYGKMIYNPEKAEYEGIQYFAFAKFGENKIKWWVWLLLGIGSFAPLASCYIIDKKLHIRGKAKRIQKLLLYQTRRFSYYVRSDRTRNAEVHYFTFRCISSATDNFSNTNKLGEGGFGAVYKGILIDGQEIAVKRLSRCSGQGVREFKNEIELIAKLQHTNLVRLLGCCVEKQEKILVYEYMPNSSLDLFLFDPRKKGQLKWKNRFVIIDGIAQGLVYLHKYSRLRVIHRDLKASNILLDGDLNPKISDFGMAKLFGINESEANTSRVVGTRGYMSPEYMMEGVVSTKTDVFSFGVLLLEIVSSKMNHGSYDVEHPLNLPGLAWELWNKGRGLDFMDPVLEDSCPHIEVMTCIHVGLLCVQDHAIDRPNMSEVISMLTNENMHLPEPKQPAFFIERRGTEAARHDNLEKVSVNGQAISILVAR